MHLRVGDVVLRRPEPSDVDALYAYKNDPAVANLLGGFTNGYSRADIEAWVEHHRTLANEIVWAIASVDGARCLGHVGLYNLDHRARRGEFAIMLGDRSVWGRGLGKAVTRLVVDYGFRFLNLNRLELSVLGNNRRAIALYESLGFVKEGTLRQAQFKDNEYINVVLMALLRAEWSGGTLCTDNVPIER